MTDGTEGFGGYQDGIPVAVQRHRTDDEAIAGGGTFVPELLSAAAVKPDFPAGEGLFQRFTVHVTEHEHFISIRVLDNGREKPVRVQF